MKTKRRHQAFVVLSVTGFSLALLAGISEQVGWAPALCTSGCSAATSLMLLSLPLWFWGALTYVVLVLLNSVAARGAFWLVFGALGVEVHLTGLMLAGGTLCLLCLGNLLVILTLAFLSLEEDRGWMAATAVSTALALVTLATPGTGRPPGPLAPNHASRVVATVAGEAITAQALEEPLASRLYELESDIHQMKKDRLDQMIARILLQKEADRQGVPLQKLVDDWILSQGVEVGEEELEQFYLENRSRWQDWKDSEAELKAQMASQLAQKKAYGKVMEFGLSLADKYGVAIHLEEPRLPVVKVSIDGEPVLGPESAPVTVVEFSDYQCPACRKHHEVTRTLRAMYPEKVRWIYKDYPLGGHKWARKAAEAARCAREQGKFWEYSDLLFARNGDELTPDRLKQFASEVGLQMERFESCADSGKYRSQVEENLQEGKRMGINTTPTYIINGKLISGGAPLDQFKKIIDTELAQSKEKG